MADLVSRIIDFLYKYNLADKTIVVGFSGGYDSMCLLDIMSKIKNLEEFENLSVIAAHYNHNWRGEEARTEQEVCRLFAASCGFEFYTKTAPGDLKKTENDARLARYEFFDEVYEDYDADAVFTAHNMDDNAETVLYRAIKGTGLYGLKGISEKRGYFYRPLLRTSRAEILEYCNENNLAPNNDSSNSDTTYSRNYLRLEVIPALEKINPTVKESLNTLAEVAQGEDAIIEEYISQIRPKVFSDGQLLPKEYINLSRPVKLRLLHEYIREIGLDYDYKRIKEIYDFLENNIVKKNGSTTSLTVSQWLYADDKIVEVIPRINKNKEEESKTKEVVIDSEGEYKFNEKTLILKKYDDREVFVFPDSTANFVYVDLSKVNLPLIFRTRKDGDVINPFGMQGSMKLKKYLNSKCVPRHKRDELLCLADDNEILWVVGVGLSNRIGVTKIPTHVIEVRDSEISTDN